MNARQRLVNARQFADAALRSGFYEAVSDVLRIASEMARREDQALAYHLCDRFGRLAWAVGNGNAGGASAALGRILDTLDDYDQGRDLRHGEDVFGFCYLLISLDAGRALSGDGRIYIFEEAKDYLMHRARYAGLLDVEGPLALQGRSPVGDAGQVERFLDVLQGVERTLVDDRSLPPFESATVGVLLQGLREVAEERAGEALGEGVEARVARGG